MPPDAAPAPPAERRHLILSLARPEAYVPMARSILGRIGYPIVSPSEWESTPELAAVTPGLCLVDERQLDAADGELPALPLVVLCGRGRSEIDDRRVRGVVAKPAGLHELYRLFQEALEPVARVHLRALTNLPVRLRREGREWHGALLSLSENGCLVRSAEPVELGAQLEVAFELPRAGRIETKAETSYHLARDTGLVFQATAPASRRAIQGFVEELLAA
jgi:hypothetical protein